MCCTIEFGERRTSSVVNLSICQPRRRSIRSRWRSYPLAACVEWKRYPSISIPTMTAGSAKSSRAIRSGPSRTSNWNSRSIPARLKYNVSLEFQSRFQLRGELRCHAAEHRDSRASAEVLRRSQHAVDRDDSSAHDVVEDAGHRDIIDDAGQLDDRARVVQGRKAVGHVGESGDPARTCDGESRLRRPHHAHGNGDPAPRVGQLGVDASQSSGRRVAEPGARARIEQSGECTCRGGARRHRGDHYAGVQGCPDARGEPRDDLCPAESGLDSLTTGECAVLRCGEGGQRDVSARVTRRWRVRDGGRRWHVVDDGDAAASAAMTARPPVDDRAWFAAHCEVGPAMPSASPGREDRCAALNRRPSAVTLHDDLHSTCTAIFTRAAALATELGLDPVDFRLGRPQAAVRPRPAVAGDVDHARFGVSAVLGSNARLAFYAALRLT